jgi:hypothetical protein
MNFKARGLFKMDYADNLIDFYNRHTCIICKRKRYERYMKRVLINSWVCTDKYHLQYCCDNKEIRIAEKIKEELKKLNHIKIQHIIGK